MTLWLRPHYQPPLVVTGPAGPQDWELDTGLADAAGRHLTDAQVNNVYDSAGRDYMAYLQANRIQEWTEYQPAERFWTFQFIEFGILAGLALLILAVAVWRLRRRGI
jgi:hypothetical protein